MKHKEKEMVEFLGDGGQGRVRRGEGGAIATGMGARVAEAAGGVEWWQIVVTGRVQREKK